MDVPHPRERSRSLNAVIFFVSRTMYCGTAKLFRLLYLLDVRHFQQTGVIATGESYAAYEFGPAPVRLFEILPHSQRWWQFELRDVLQRKHDESIDFGQVCWSAPEAAFDDDSFSPLQLSLLADLAKQHALVHYREIDLSPDNGAWEATWFHGRGKGSVIPWERTLRVDDPKTPLILELHEEEQARLAARRVLRNAKGHAAEGW